MLGIDMYIGKVRRRYLISESNSMFLKLISRMETYVIPMLCSIVSKFML